MSLKKLEFAWVRDGLILVGYNPQTEEGGWIPVGDVTEPVKRLEAERDNALALLADARQQLESIRRRLAAALQETDND